MEREARFFVVVFFFVPVFFVLALAIGLCPVAVAAVGERLALGGSAAEHRVVAAVQAQVGAALHHALGEQLQRLRVGAHGRHAARHCRW